jgi:putative membrane protein
MARSANTLTSLASFASMVALALGGLAGCGGSDANTPPQTPASSTSVTAAEPPVAPPTPPSDSSPADSMTQPANAGGLDAIRGTPPTGASRNGTVNTNGSPMSAQPSTGIQAAAAAPATGPSTSSAAPTFSDAQIIAVTGAANLGEIEQARAALTKARNPRVKQFAQRMIGDHQAAESKGQAIAKKGNIVAEENDVSRELKAGGAQVMSSLRSASAGEDFDRTYVAAQVAEHTRVLQLLDDKLVPQATSAALKSHLQAVRVKVAMHLTMAKDIQSSLQ